MNYSRDYPKFQKRHYTTIRKRKFGKVINDIEPEKVKGIISHYSKILKIEKKRLSAIPTDLLCQDTNTNSRKEALELLQSFYRTDISLVPYWYIFYMEKLTPEEFQELKSKVKDIGIEEWI